MEKMIESLITENLVDARKRAKKFAQYQIANYLVQQYGWSVAKSQWAALYLKGNALAWDRYYEAK